ncbi:MAG: hypothetical protein K6F15_10340 [Treponema sp.]|nr:hypothetical protein [Treponema sp.]
MFILEIIAEYNKIPLRERQKKSKDYEDLLRKHLKRETQINNIINQWLRGEENSRPELFDEDESSKDGENWSSEEELMRMYGVRNKEELNDLQETNSVYHD